MARRIAERVSKVTFDQWRGRLRLMALEPYSLSYGVSACKCGDYDCVKTRLYTEEDSPLVLFAMAKKDERRYYAALDRLMDQWKVYKEVERVLWELSTAGEM